MFTCEIPRSKPNRLKFQETRKSIQERLFESYSSEPIVDQLTSIKKTLDTEKMPQRSFGKEDDPKIPISFQLSLGYLLKRRILR